MAHYILRKVIIAIVACFFVNGVLSSVNDALAASVDDIRVLKISARDERAVIKTLDGKTQVIKPGDSIGTNGKITEIAADRVVIEEKKGKTFETIIIRLYNGKQSVERLKKTKEPAPLMYAPSTYEKDAKKLK